MRFFFALFLIAVLAFISTQVYRLNNQRVVLNEEIMKLSEEETSLIKENARLASDIEYFQADANLVKDARAKFNYRSPTEKLLILIPSNTEQ